MTATKLVRMARCTYTVPGETEWVALGRARTRCPRCGAELKPEDSSDRHHVPTLRPTNG